MKKTSLPKMSKLMLSVFVAGSVFLGVTTPSIINSVKAQENPDNEVGLVAIPPRTGENGELKLYPGETKQITVRVRNATRNNVDVNTIIKDMLVDEDGATPYAIDDNVSNRWSLASWMTVTPSHHVLGARETAQISVIIEVPEDALPGGHYAMILHQPQSPKKENGQEAASAGVTQRTGTLVYVTVDGAINEEAFIRNFNFPKFTEYGPVPFSFEVENRSDIHIRPQTTVEIYNLFGKKIQSIQLDTKNIFPFTDRSFENQWGRIWGFGLYKAKLIMSFGDQGNIVMSNTTFWLLPIKLIIAIITIFLSIIAIGVAIHRHIKHKQEIERNRVVELEGKLEELENN